MSERTLFSIARFVMIGGSATCLNLCLLWLFVRQLGVWYLGAAVLSYCVSIVYNFFLQRSWAFASRHSPMMEQLPQFVAANLFGLVLNTMIFFAMVKALGTPVMFSQAVASLAVAIFSFGAYRYLFGRDQRQVWNER